jgi:hypothetical protein
MTTMLDTRTLQDRAIRAQADRALHVARATERPWFDDGTLAVAWQGDRGVFTNLAVVLEAPTSWSSVVERISEVVPPGRPAMLVSPFTVPDLSSSGWTLVGQPPFMVRPVGPADGRAVPAELTVVEADDQPSLEVFERTLVEAYPEPAMQPYRYGDFLDARALDGQSLRCFTGFVAGTPVATAGAFVANGVNLVELVSTMPAVRGRGYGEALTWAATLADPALPAVLFASDLGRPTYERMGYLAVTRWTLWLRRS